MRSMPLMSHVTEVERRCSAAFSCGSFGSCAENRCVCQVHSYNLFCFLNSSAHSSLTSQANYTGNRCQYYWETSTFGLCSSTCGVGQKTRSVTVSFVAHHPSACFLQSSFFFAAISSVWIASLDFQLAAVNVPRSLYQVLVVFSFFVSIA